MVDLSDDDPAMVKLLVHYFYHLDYPYSQTESAKTPGRSSKSSKLQALNAAATPKGGKDILLKQTVQNRFQPRADGSGRYEAETIMVQMPLILLSFEDSYQPRPKKKAKQSASSLPAPGPPTPLKDTNLSLHFNIYTLADKYVIQGLKSLQ